MEEMETSKDKPMIDGKGVHWKERQRTLEERQAQAVLLVVF